MWSLEGEVCRQSHPPWGALLRGVAVTLLCIYNTRWQPDKINKFAMTYTCRMGHYCDLVWRHICLQELFFPWEATLLHDYLLLYDTPWQPDKIANFAIMYTCRMGHQTWMYRTQRWLRETIASQMSEHYTLSTMLKSLTKLTTNTCVLSILYQLVNRGDDEELKNNLPTNLAMWVICFSFM